MKKKKILGICGTTKKEEFSSSHFLLEQALDAAKENNAEVKLIHLADYNIKECLGCGNCLSNRKCPLHEEEEDQHKLLYKECINADGFIFSSPVYALSLPSIWKKWIDRCDVNEEKDLEYDYYNYDTVTQVKGKAFAGKVAGQIAVAAGIGHEMALASLMPAFTAVKLTIVANAGISLIEYDAEPGIKREKWSKNIKDAGFAIDMARAVGKRVSEAVGFSAFDLENKKEKKKDSTDTIGKLLTMPLYTIDDKEISLESCKEGLIVLIISSKDTLSKGKEWVKKINKEFEANRSVKVIGIACIGQIPHFIKRDFIKENIKANAGENEILIDWDGMLEKENIISSKESPWIIIMDQHTKGILYSKESAFNKENKKIVKSKIRDWMNV